MAALLNGILERNFKCLLKVTKYKQFEVVHLIYIFWITCTWRLHDDVVQHLLQQTIAFIHNNNNNRVYTVE